MRPSIRWFIVAFVAAAACKGTEPFVPVATTVTVTPGTISFTAVGAAQTLAATVLDQRDNAMPNATVTWSTNNPSVATVGGTGIVTSTGNGSAQITATSGLATGHANVDVAQVSSALLKWNGDGQTGSVGTALPTALTAKLIDGYGSPIAGVAVTWMTITGSLSTPGGTITDGNGFVSANWTLGTTSGSQQATVTGGGETAAFTATANAGPPASVVVQAGDSQRAAQGTPVPVRPAVQVRDQYSNLVAGAAVAFAVDSGGGSVTGANPTTNGSGIATVGSWTVGTGNNTLIATVSGTGPVKFHATGVVPGAPKQLIVTAGNGQTGLIGYALNVPPAVEVVDSEGFPVPNKLVTFAVTGGGGSVTGDTMTTGTSGIATVGSWTVQLGANTLGASIPDAGVTNNPLSFTATGAAPDYDISIRPLTTMSPSRRAVFDSAAAHWERLIYGDVPDIPVNIPGDTLKKYCTGRTTPTLNETIDDIVIYAILDSIDGPGKVLGRAGPCYIRSSGFQPVIGVMFFDTADVASFPFDVVVTHEMGHVIGFGTIWGGRFLNLVVGPTTQGGTDPHFVGPQALAAFDRIGGTGYTAGAKVPVENCCTPGGGSNDAHWREAVFGDELMTSFLGATGVPKPLSVLTVASMGDEGYQVNYAGADAFSLTFAALRAQAGGGQAVPLVDDILRLPIGVVDARGRFVQWVMPR
ncbi:MAG: hypothetical protein DMD37_05840 [Gemmatimonadetes bacterium]|nr:MAG: hypothetical protein DMD37_05840 [Gemmatimonadota bacterium]